MEIPALQWGDSKRADGTTRHWNPEPLTDLGATLVCVAYRPRTEIGERWYAVGMTPPKLLAKTLLNTKLELDECHKHGIRVIGYADAIMFHPEMLEPEGITCDDLYAIGRTGERVINKMWDTSGASVSCIMNPRWVELQKQVARVTSDAGFDGLQFDVYPYAIEPGYLCRCRYCEEAWAEHSRKVFGSAQPMPGLDTGKLDFRKAADREFKVWRLQSFVDFVKGIERDVRRSHPGFIIIMNHGGGTPDYTYEAVHGGLRYPSTELWHLKLGDDSSLYIYSSTEAANGAQAIGLINFPDQMKPDYRYRVALAEAHAGGGTFYAVTGKREDGGAPKISHEYCDFVRLHQDWYVDTRSGAEVAVLYSWRDQAFLQGDPVTEGKVEFDPKRDHFQRASAALARMGVPHDCLIVEKGLNARVLSPYKVVVAPELSLVDDEDAAALEQFVRGGGRLVVIGELGTITESGHEFKKRDRPLSVQWGIASVPDLAGVRDLCSQLRIKSASPFETTIRAKGAMRAIHLIRFGDPEVVDDRSVMVDYELPKGYRAAEVNVWSPDFPAAEMKSSWEQADGRLKVKIGRIDNYALVGVTLRRK